MRTLNLDYQTHLNRSITLSPEPENGFYLTRNGIYGTRVGKQAFLWIIADADCGKSVMAK